MIGWWTFNCSHKKLHEAEVTFLIRSENPFINKQIMAIVGGGSRPWSHSSIYPKETTPAWSSLVSWQEIHLSLLILPRIALRFERRYTIPQRSFGHFRGPHGFWPLLKITKFKVQNSLLRTINLYIYYMVYLTVEYIRISSNLCFRTTILYNSCTICFHYLIWAGSWPTSRFAIQAISEF